MRSAIVKASKLGDDWRAEAHVEPSPETLKEAQIAGKECGLRGTQTPPKRWTDYGNKGVEKAFQDAYLAGLKVRSEFLEGKPCPSSK